MSVHFHVLERLFDQRHVAGDAFAACGVQLVMRILAEMLSANGPIGGLGPWQLRHSALPFSRSMGTLPLP